MRALKLCLWLAALLCLLSVVGLVLPFSALQSVTKALTGQSLPESPVLVYAVRVTSATYVAVGVFLIILARDPLRYGVLVPFTGVASVFIGLACGVTGLLARMPGAWFLGDSLGSVAFGVLIFTSWRRATAAGPQAEPLAPAAEPEQ